MGAGPSRCHLEMVTAFSALQRELDKVRQAQTCSRQAPRWESVKSAFVGLIAYTVRNLNTPCLLRKTS